MFHKELQEWFGGVLRSPLEEQKIQLKHIPQASEYITGTAFMKPHERLEIYNQQYWWRLYSAIQQVFPAVTKWLGVGYFNQKIAEPYLLAHGPSDWSLYNITDDLLSFLEKSDCDPMTFKLARLDRTFYETFFGAVCDKPLNPEELFVLQNHVKLVDLKEDLLTFRQDLLEGKKPQKALKKTVKAALYRVPLSGKTFWQELSEEEFLLLKSFAKQQSLEEALAPFSEETSLDIAAAFGLFTTLRLIKNVDAQE